MAEENEQGCRMKATMPMPSKLFPRGSFRATCHAGRGDPGISLAEGFLNAQMKCRKGQRYA